MIGFAPLRLLPHARRIRLLAAAIVALLALVAVAAAQDQPQAPAARQPDTPATGQAPAAAAPPPSAWAMVCDAAAPETSGSSACAIVQELVAERGGPRILRVSVRPVADARATAPGAAGQAPGGGTGDVVARLRLDLPFGLDFLAGINLRVDGESWTKMPVRSCLADGCFAGLLLHEADLARLKSGGRMGVIVQSLSGRSIAWPVTLAGFTAAYNKLPAEAP